MNKFILCTAFIIAMMNHALAETYSPFADRSYPDNVYWGDTHLHTTLSHDAFHMGNRLTSDDAYRFAKGEEVRASSGVKVRLVRPLDFLMVSDHAENLGVLSQLAAGGGSLPRSEARDRWGKTIRELPPLVDILQASSVDEYTAGAMELAMASGARHDNYELDDEFRQSVWKEVIANAERHNNPGIFTAFIGYEWSATVLIPGKKGLMVHRNVLFRGGANEASQVLPYSRFDSSDPEDLWAYLHAFEDKTNGEVLAIPHNSNLSGGNSFKLATYDGQPLTKDYARTRSRWEPIAEVTQRKGDGETHPVASPDDEFADYETMGNPSLMEAQSYARPALKQGLGQQAELGANPFKFGMIGSTDAHNSLPTSREDNYWGSTARDEPSRYRTGIAGRAASGYAAVWATENTREALFDAMRRREVYASTGPRMTVRFFGGWEYANEDASSPDLASVGYAKGVPMGGDLTDAPRKKAPSFLIRAVKDPDSANLDRIQVVKGWRDNKGELHEKIYNVALSDGRKDGRPVGNTVDLDTASYKNSIGDPEFSVVWSDPEFDRNELAFYYVRVLEIPTPRWTAYDAKFFDLKDLPDDIPMVTQERVYTSPIWYTP